jgi:hypothetical protein
MLTATNINNNRSVYNAAICRSLGRIL